MRVAANADLWQMHERHVAAAFIDLIAPTLRRF
jgi:hypothetical protein